MAGEGSQLTQLAIFNPDIHATVTEFAQHRGVNRKTVFSWIYDGWLPAIRGTTPPDQPGYRAAKFQWLVPREHMDIPRPYKQVGAQETPSIQADYHGQMVEWISIAEAARRRQCSIWRIKDRVRRNTLPAIERQESRLRVYVLASAVDKLDLTQVAVVHSAKKAPTAVLSTARLRPDSPPRVVRAADGWRIEAWIGVGARRSQDIWRTRKQAQAALDAGYTMTAPLTPRTYPRVHRIGPVPEMRWTTCLLCAAQNSIMDAHHTVWIEIAPHVKRKTAICAVDAHDIAAEYVAIEAPSRLHAAFTRKAGRSINA